MWYVVTHHATSKNTQYIQSNKVYQINWEILWTKSVMIVKRLTVLSMEVAIKLNHNTSTSEKSRSKVSKSYSLEHFLLQVLIHGGGLRHFYWWHGVHMETEDLRTTETNHKALKQIRNKAFNHVYCQGLICFVFDLPCWKGFYLNLPMLRLLWSKAPVGIHWIALAEHSHMHAHVPGFQPSVKGVCINLYWPN